MKSDYAISELCEALAVSRSGFHGWDQRRPGARAQANATLLPLIRQAHQESRLTYGSPRITHWLRAHGHRCGRVRVARLMRQIGLSHRPRRRFRPMSLTDSNHDLPVAPNLLVHRRPTLQPNAVWVADITYVATDEGWLYVAGVLDLHSRKLVGWSMADHMETSLVSDALGMALARRSVSKGLVHHSDRGVQYASLQYQALLDKHGITVSMSGKGDCYDNAMMESFWATLKCELVHQQSYATAEQARQSLFEYIEVFYNRKRLHSSLGYVSPESFEAAA
jgi:putative transposase